MLHIWIARLCLMCVDARWNFRDRPFSSKARRSRNAVSCVTCVVHCDRVNVCLVIWVEDPCPPFHVGRMWFKSIKWVRFSKCISPWLSAVWWNATLRKDTLASLVYYFSFAMLYFEMYNVQATYHALFRFLFDLGIPMLDFGIKCCWDSFWNFMPII